MSSDIERLHQCRHRASCEAMARLVDWMDFPRMAVSPVTDNLLLFLLFRQGQSGPVMLEPPSPEFEVPTGLALQLRMPESW